MKLRRFQGAHVGGVRLIEQRGEFAEHRAGFRHLGDLDAAFDDADRAGFEDDEPPGIGAFGEHGLAGAVARERKRGKLVSPDLGVVGRRHSGAPSVPRRLRTVPRQIIEQIP